MNLLIKSSVFLLLLASAFFAPSVSAAAATKLEGKETKLKTESLVVGGKRIVAEIADTDPSREHGLMNRTHMGENEGMLFVFEKDEMLGFWMKNTLIPLAIGYFDSKMSLIEVHEMVPAPMGDMFPKSYPSSKPARYALEMNKGWYARHNVKPGAKLVRARPLPGK